MKKYNVLIFLTGIILILPAMGTNTYYLSILVTSFILVIFTLSWDLIGGICGQLTLGHALFFGTGTYSFAVLCTIFNTPVPAAFAATLIISLLLALTTGIFAIKLKGAFFALFTLALGELAHELSRNISFPSAKKFFVGGEGGIPLGSGQGILDKNSLLLEYYICLLIVILLVILLLRILQKTTGLELRAIAGNELLAKSCGVKTQKLKLMAYSIAALIATTGGIISVVHTGRATPGDFSIELSFQAATLAAVGGRGRVTGPALAALGITALFSTLHISPIIRMTVYALVLPAMLLGPYPGFFPQKKG